MVTRGYMGLQSVTRDNRGLQAVITNRRGKLAREQGDSAVVSVM